MRHKQRHPLIHTLEHIAVVVAVLVLGVFVGEFSSNRLGEESQLAQTSAGTMTTMTNATTDNTATMSGVTQPPPQITNVRVTDISQSSAMIRWMTDQRSDSRVFYSTELTLVSGMLSTVRCDAGGGVTEHCVQLFGLTPSVQYALRVESRNAEGTMGSQVAAPFRTLVSGMTTTASSTTGSDSGGTQLPTTSTEGKPTLFTVQTAESICLNGERQTYVAFISLPLDGGYFRVTGNGRDDLVEPGPNYLFKNGTYRWEGLARGGFLPSGETRGEFVISGDCAGLSTTPIDIEGDAEGIAGTTSTTSGVQTTATTALKENSIVTRTIQPTTPGAIAITMDPTAAGGEPLTLRIFSEEERLSSGGAAGGMIELRIVASDAKRVRFVAESGCVTRVVGDARVDNLLSRGDEDVWTYFLDTTTFPNAPYVLRAKLSMVDGRTLESNTMQLTIKNVTPIAATNAARIDADILEGTTSPESLSTVTPLECTSGASCVAYCAKSLTHRTWCDRLARELFVHTGATTTLDSTSTIPATLGAATNAGVVEQFFAGRSGARVFADADDDGVADYDEINIYFTDPDDADSDNDGALDGAELLARTNPIREVAAASTTAEVPSIPIELPTEAGLHTPRLLAVTEIAPLATTTDAAGNPIISKIALRGYAPPGSFVTVYIFSDPIIVTVKADADGVWQYTLERELPDGAHKAYSAIVDTSGKIIAKSSALPFVKQAAAVSVGADILPASAQAPGFNLSLTALIAFLIGVVGIALSVVGFVISRHHPELHHQQ